MLFFHLFLFLLRSIADFNANSNTAIDHHYDWKISHEDLHASLGYWSRSSLYMLLIQFKLDEVVNMGSFHITLWLYLHS